MILGLIKRKWDLRMSLKEKAACHQPGIMFKMGWYIFPCLCLQLFFGVLLWLAVRWTTPYSLLVLLFLIKRSYGKYVCQWPLWVGVWTFAAFLLLTGSGQESCDWHRTERVRATSAWLWPWQTTWPHPGSEIWGSSQCADSPISCMLVTKSLCALINPHLKQRWVHHHSGLCISNEETNVLKCCGMGGTHTEL